MLNLPFVQAPASPERAPCEPRAVVTKRSHRVKLQEVAN
jgi:hypothetical protein